MQLDLTMGQPLLFSIMDKACFDYGMIEKGDKILVGASGGKDSTALIEYFSNRLKRKSSSFTFEALYIQSEFAPPMNASLLSLFEKWGVKLNVLEINVQGRLKEGEKMSCYWCSTQRRKELLDFAVKNGFNKIALGHHLDDILETVLMNALGKGILEGMPPVLSYKKWPVTIIRPLCYSSQDVIVEHSLSRGYKCYTCTCLFQDNSARKDARKRIEDLTDGDRNKKEKLFKALKSVCSEYLP